MTESIEGWLTTTQAAALIGVSEAMLRYMVDKQGAQIETRRVGRSTMWKRSDVERLAAERKGQG